jgi:hypothetical protein
MGPGRLAGKISKSVLGKRARKGLKIRRQMPAFSAYGMAVTLIIKGIPSSPKCERGLALKLLNPLLLVKE